MALLRFARWVCADRACAATAGAIAEATCWPMGLCGWMSLCCKDHARTCQAGATTLQPDALWASAPSTAGQQQLWMMN